MIERASGSALIFASSFRTRPSIHFSQRPRDEWHRKPEAVGLHASPVFAPYPPLCSTLPTRRIESLTLNLISWSVASGDTTACSAAGMPVGSRTRGTGGMQNYGVQKERIRRSYAGAGVSPTQSPCRSRALELVVMLPRQPMDASSRPPLGIFASAIAS
ncbi:hypothetical protein J3F84DRAFT_385248 [Trichoderma pleuroticola]